MAPTYSIAACLNYLRRPYFPAGREPVGEAALRHLAQLLGISLALIIVLSGVIGGLIASVNGGVPDNVNAQLAEQEEMKRKPELRKDSFHIEMNLDNGIQKISVRSCGIFSME